MQIKHSQLKQIPVDQIDPCPYQPRRIFEETEIQQLAESIKELGLIQPMVVRQAQSGRYELIAGERRWRACQQAGIATVAVIVRSDSDAEAASAALVENIQRVDLNAMEVAEALQRLMQQENLSQEKLAEKVGKKRSTVANFLRLLQLPEKVQWAVAAGKISMGHAKVILSVDGQRKQEALYTKIMCRGLSVREAECAALQMCDKKLPKQRVLPLGQDEHLIALADALQKKLGTKVKITGSKSGKIAVEYYSLDDLDRILEKLDVSI